jgi:uncharacterized membrane protein
MPPSHIQEHIELIAKHEQEFLNNRRPLEKIADRVASFVGSLAYVSVHVLVGGCWIVWNSLAIAGRARFDPFPFPLLDFVFAFEAILVASFILMRQSSVSRRSDERDQLMLQILLLAEREMTAMLGMQRDIANAMGLHRIARDEKITELSQETSIDEVVQNINESLPT